MMHVIDISKCGWTVTDGTLSIEWDSKENQIAVTERVGLLTKGCKCRTGCVTGRCGCKRKGQTCSEGCECLHCMNLPGTSTKEQHEASDAAELENEENRELCSPEFQNFLEDSSSDSDASDNESNSDSELLSD